jgi:hypothetical protein
MADGLRGRFLAWLVRTPLTGSFNRPEPVICRQFHDWFVP